MRTKLRQNAEPDGKADADEDVAALKPVRLEEGIDGAGGVCLAGDTGGGDRAPTIAQEELESKRIHLSMSCSSRMQSGAWNAVPPRHPSRRSPNQPRSGKK